MTGHWFSPGPPVSSINKTDRHNITEILLKVAWNTTKQTNCYYAWQYWIKQVANILRDLNSGIVNFFTSRLFGSTWDGYNIIWHFPIQRWHRVTKHYYLTTWKVLKVLILLAWKEECPKGIYSWDRRLNRPTFMIRLFFSLICATEGDMFYVYIRVLHDIHEIWCSCCLTIKRRVSLVEQELPTFPKYVIPFPVFSWVRVAQSYVFFVVVCNSLFVLFSFFIYLWHCISFLDVRLLVTSNFSTSHEYYYLI